MRRRRVRGERLQGHPRHLDLVVEQALSGGNRAVRRRRPDGFRKEERPFVDSRFAGVLRKVRSHRDVIVTQIHRHDELAVGHRHPGRRLGAAHGLPQSLVSLLEKDSDRAGNVAPESDAEVDRLDAVLLVPGDGEHAANAVAFDAGKGQRLVEVGDLHGAELARLDDLVERGFPLARTGSQQKRHDDEGLQAERPTTGATVDHHQTYQVSDHGRRSNSCVQALRGCRCRLQ